MSLALTQSNKLEVSRGKKKIGELNQIDVMLSQIMHKETVEKNNAHAQQCCDIDMIQINQLPLKTNQTPWLRFIVHMKKVLEYKMIPVFLNYRCLKR